MSATPKTKYVLSADDLIRSEFFTQGNSELVVDGLNRSGSTKQLAVDVGGTGTKSADLVNAKILYYDAALKKIVSSTNSHDFTPEEVDLSDYALLSQFRGEGAGNFLQVNWAQVLVRPAQIVQALKSTSETIAAVSGSSNWIQISGMTKTITPTISTAKFRVQVVLYIGGRYTLRHPIKLVRVISGGATTSIGLNTDGGTSSPIVLAGGIASNIDYVYALSAATIDYIDSPTTGSDVTYRVELYQQEGDTVSINKSETEGAGNGIARVVSSITITEIF